MLATSNSYEIVSQSSEVELSPLNDAGASCQLTASPMATDKPHLWSITYQQLLDIEVLARRHFGSWNFHNKSMRHIVDAIVIPKCQERGVSYALALNRQGLQVDAFITHSWDEPFADFVSSIRTAFRPFTRKPNLWICAFAMIQGSDAHTEEILDVPLRESPFVQALSFASWFVVVRNSQTDLYSRIWCVSELMFAREFGFTTTNKTLVIGPNNFSHLRTSCLQAQATNARDKQRILSALQQEHDNLESIDALVLEYRMHHGDDFHVQRLMRVLLLFGTACLLVAGSIGVIVWQTQDISDTIAYNVWEGNENLSVDPNSPLLRAPFPDFSIQAILQNPSSPQAKAWSWLKAKDMRTWMVGEQWVRQKFALATIYFATNGSSWLLGLNELDKLDRLENPCEIFTGMICNETLVFEISTGERCYLGGNFLNYPFKCNADGAVTSVNLSLHDVHGSLPPEVALLKELSSLDMRSPYLTGTVPTEIGWLQSLTDLRLGGNGPIPSELGNFSQLQYLQIDGASFQSSIPSEIGLLTSLNHLELGQQLVGPLPRNIFLLSNLQECHLRGSSSLSTVSISIENVLLDESEEILPTMDNFAANQGARNVSHIFDLTAYDTSKEADGAEPVFQCFLIIN